MAKQLRPEAITEADLSEYVEGSSSFAFELECLRVLKEIGWNCEHGGTYVDPVTQKPRQFDIRADYKNDDFSYRLAIECKAIAANYPLLVFCVPRLKEESFHDVVYAFDPDLIKQEIGFVQYAKCFRLARSRSIYPPSFPVGKSCSQVGRENDKFGNLVGDDRELYEKWSQALSSGCELIEGACPSTLTEGRQLVSFIQPVLVVPDGTLWQVDFNDYGASVQSPHPVNDVAYYVDHEYDGGDRFCQALYSMSHLRIVTKTGLISLCKNMIEDDIDIFSDFLTAQINHFLKLNRV